MNPFLIFTILFILVSTVMILTEAGRRALQEAPDGLPRSDRALLEVIADEALHPDAAGEAAGVKAPHQRIRRLEVDGLMRLGCGLNSVFRVFSGDRSNYYHVRKRLHF